MTAKRCWDCGTTFYSDYGAVRCNVCHQGRETRKHSDQQAREAQREAQWQAEQDRAAQARHTQALINAENARIAAINHQTQVIMESGITSKYAYDRGYNYIDTEFDWSNEANLSIQVNEYGSLGWNWNHPYLTDRLNEEFKKGLADKLNTYPSIYDTIKASARQAGKQNAEGTLGSRFWLHTGLKIGEVDIKTKTFNSKFTNTLDEETGEQVMRWSQPFENEELNQAYLDGVNEVHWVVNTPEQMNYRLRVQVPELKAERIIAKETKRWNKIFKVLVYVIPIMFFLLMWQVTSSWVLYGMLIVSIVMRNGLEMLHEKWAENNSNYLR